MTVIVVPLAVSVGAAGVARVVKFDEELLIAFVPFAWTVNV